MESAHLPATSDAELVLACQNGDMQAFEALYRNYFDAVYDFAARTMKDRHAAADVVQDAFIKAHERIGQLRNPEAFRPWLYAIVRREALNGFRSQNREAITSTLDDDAQSGVNPLLTQVADDPSENPVAAAELSDSAALVWDAAASLDADTYTVLDLHVRQGLSSAEIAEVLGISKGNAYTKVNRMKERIGTAISTYLLIRKGSKDCDELARIVAPESLPPVSAKLRRSVDRHTRTCETCEERRRALVSPMSIFAAMAAVPPPAGLKAAIWGNIASAPPKAGTVRARRWLPFALGALIIMLVGAATGMGIARFRPVAAAEAIPVLVVSPPSSTAGVGDAPADPAPAPSTPTTVALVEASDESDSVPPATSPPATTPPATAPAPPPPPPETEPTTPTTALDTTPPVLGQATGTPGAIWELDEDFLSCPAGTAREATLSIAVTDVGSGVGTVEASWTIGGSATTVTMAASGTTYTSIFGPFDYLTVPDSTSPSIDILITANDVAGNSSKTALSITVNSLSKCFV